MDDRKRDFRAEYARRIARGVEKGLSRSQARGHPKRYEKRASKKLPPRPIDDDRLQVALKVLRQEKSLSAAAKEAKISPERLRNYLSENKLARRRNRRWFVRKALPRRMLLFTDGAAKEITIGDFASASKVGRFMSTVQTFLRTNNAAGLKPFEGVAVRDIAGVSHTFETRPNILYRLHSAHDQNFEQIYRIVV